MKMSLKSAGGTCIASAFFIAPLPRSKKSRRGCGPPVPSSTMMLVPDCSFVGGNGVLPRKLIRSSFLGSSSVPGKYTFRFQIESGGR